MQVLQTSVPSSLLESNSCSVSGSSGMNRIEWKRLASLSFERGTAALDGGEIREWALDFAHDAVACGRAIRVLSVDALYAGVSLSDPSPRQLRIQVATLLVLPIALVSQMA
jgi:hypothetical protein